MNECANKLAVYHFSLGLEALEQLILISLRPNYFSSSFSRQKENTFAQLWVRKLYIERLGKLERCKNIPKNLMSSYVTVFFH